MDLLDEPGNPVPEGTVVGSVTTDDGVTLRFARFPAVVGSPRGTVILCQGRTEQIEKYFHVAASLRARGFAVVAFDWRGQGGSARLTRDPTRGHVRDFDDYGRDFDAVKRHVVLPDCPPPYFCIAHSMGALAMLLASPRHVPFLSRLVLTAPLFDFESLPVSRRTVRRASAILCALGLGKAVMPRARAMTRRRDFAENVLTSDSRRFAVMNTIIDLRPELGLGPPTVGWINAAARAMDRIDADAFPARVPVPVMLVNCAADTVVSCRAIERMARRLRSPAYILVPGARHEILMERPVYTDQFWAAFDAFVPGTGVSGLNRPAA